MFPNMLFSPPGNEVGCVVIGVELSRVCGVVVGKGPAGGVLLGYDPHANARCGGVVQGG